jgi:hypothetical protein
LLCIKPLEEIRCMIGRHQNPAQRSGRAKHLLIVGQVANHLTSSLKTEKIWNFESTHHAPLKRGALDPVAFYKTARRVGQNCGRATPTSPFKESGRGPLIQIGEFQTLSPSPPRTLQHWTCKFDAVQ